MPELTDRHRLGYFNERYAERKKQKRCVDCGDPINDHARCFRCRVKRSKLLYRWRRKE